MSTRVLVAHEAETIREILRRLLEAAGYVVTTVGDGNAALRACDDPPAALVLDVALPEVHAYKVVEEVQRIAPATRIVLVASVYNRTGYKRRPTSLYGADDYVEQHHIPDQLVSKLERLIGLPQPIPVSVMAKIAAESPQLRGAEDGQIAAAGNARMEPRDLDPSRRAERLARLIIADIALYNGDAIDHEDDAEREARLRVDLDEGRLLFELRIPEEVWRKRDFLGEAMAEIRAQRRHAATADASLASSAMGHKEGA